MLEWRAVESSDGAKQKWKLNQDAFNLLLRAMERDGRTSDDNYQLLHRRLERFFENHLSALAAELADETLNRVARKLQEGIEIRNVSSYALGVARLVLREMAKQERKKVEFEESPAPSPRNADQEKSEARANCLDGCLAKLPVETRRLIVDYYELRKQARINNRKLLAEDLGIPLSTLRLRAHHIRRRLEKCMGDCLNETNSSDMD